MVEGRLYIRRNLHISLKRNMSTDHNYKNSMSLVNYMDSDNSSNDSDDDDNAVEVVSSCDEKENDLIDMTKNLMFSSDDESDTNGDSDFGGESIAGDDDIHCFSPGGTNDPDFRHGALHNIRSAFHNINDHRVTLVDKDIHSLTENIFVESKSNEFDDDLIELNTLDTYFCNKCRFKRPP